VPILGLHAVLAYDPELGVRTVDAEVRRDDHLPLRADIRFGDGRAIAYRYPVAEYVPRAQGSRHFVLPIPPGVPIIESRTLSVAQAAGYPYVMTWWLGRSFDGLAFAPVGPSGMPSSPVEPGLQLSRWVGPSDPMGRFYGSFPSTGDRVFMAGPNLGRTSVTALYGDRASADARHGAGPYGPFMMVTSYPPTATANWAPRYWTAPRWTTVAGRKALYYSTALGPWTARYAIVDTGDATVMVSGLGVTAAQVERAAARLVRVR
jgi:hypothetical protein